jgi:hypothetical protein
MRLGARAAHVATSLAFLGAFLSVYRDYLSINHSYTGLYYRPLTTAELAFMVVGVAVVAAFLPARLDRPSAIVLWLLHVFVVVPTLAVTFLVGADVSLSYVPALLALCGTMIAASILTGSRPPPPSSTPLPDRRLLNALIVVWALSTAVLVARFASIMNFAGVSDIYYQRAVASEAGADVLFSYLRPYYTYVFSPALLALGLLSRRWAIAGLGVAGMLIAYSIDALKVALILPVAVFGVWFALRRGIGSLWQYTGGMAVLTAICSVLANQTAVFSYVADVVLLRSMAIPGQAFSQYADYFGARGLTCWSNVRGLGLVIPTPEAYVADPDWPVLGNMIGRHYYTWAEGVNVNANLFAGEGVAAAGALGVFVIGLALAVWLRVLDAVGARWSRTATILLMIPPGLALTNVHLSTMLITFGGAFWTALFYMYNPAAPRTQPRRFPVWRPS